MILLENQFLYVFRLLILGQMYIYLLTLNAWCFGAGCCTSVIFYLYLLKSIYKCKIVPKCCEPVEMIHIFDLI